MDEDLIYNINDYDCIDCCVKLIGEDDDGNEWFKYILKDEYGRICESEDECRHFSRLVVGVNIIKCEIIED